jgi:hypothetical protein
VPKIDDYPQLRENQDWLRAAVRSLWSAETGTRGQIGISAKTQRLGLLVDGSICC